MTAESLHMIWLRMVTTPSMIVSYCRYKYLSIDHLHGLILIKRVGMAGPVCIKVRVTVAASSTHGERAIQTAYTFFRNLCMIAAGPQRQTGKQHDPHLIHKNAIYSSSDTHIYLTDQGIPLCVTIHTCNCMHNILFFLLMFPHSHAYPNHYHIEEGVRADAAKEACVIRCGPVIFSFCLPLMVPPGRTVHQI